MIKSLHRIYKTLFSKTLKLLFGGGCRFYPTCSDYSDQALAKYGIGKGTWLAIKRISRCHPFSKHAYYDPLIK